jgi:general secretion pathway protein D
MRCAAIMTLSIVVAGGATGQQGAALITPNYKEADLGQVIDAVSQVTGKNFILDPRVKAQVTMLSTTPMTPAAFYEAFLAILQVHGFIAVPAGNVIKILPDANARQLPANDLPDSVSATSDEIVTQVIQIRNVAAAQLVPILRPLIPQYGHLAAYPASNILIISDRASNVSRMVRIVNRIDQSGDNDIDVLRLEHASASEIVRVVNSLMQGAGGGGEGGGQSARIVADERTNSVLISGDSGQRLRVKALIAHLDTPLDAGGDTQVRYLRYADAEKIAPKLKEQMGVVQAAQQGASTAGSSSSSNLDKQTGVWADPETNALVITAPPKTMRSLMQVVDRLDIRRAQVLVEALIVEVSADKTAELGINWAIDGRNGNNLVGLFNVPMGAPGTSAFNLTDVAKAISEGKDATNIPTGPFIGGGRYNEDSGTNFVAILKALRGDGNTNVVSMPSVLTLDNEEAQIKVAQEVPFVTGQYTNTGGNNNGSVNPFQTIQREEVGTILKITPQITDDDTIMLKIEQEASSLAASSAGAVDLITNKRTINTRVLVDDGGMVVLGGLISDSLQESGQKVPVLGDIPLIGNAFRTRGTRKSKTNLLVFIRPRVLRDAEAAAVETNAKYNYIRDLQLNRRKGKVQLLPTDRQPTLPELDTTPRTAPSPAPVPALPPPVTAPGAAETGPVTP